MSNEAPIAPIIPPIVLKIELRDILAAVPIAI
uniref:Uncharacterized protein n=1 Tax=Saccharolobus solfataricus (strain 98/2) TaxID=555311 RepID=D0KTF6_SACS9